MQHSIHQWMTRDYLLGLDETYDFMDVPLSPFLMSQEQTLPIRSS